MSSEYVATVQTYLGSTVAILRPHVDAVPETVFWSPYILGTCETLSNVALERIRGDRLNHSQ